MPGLSRIVDVAEALRTPAVVVSAERCTHRHHRASTCSRCTDVCPSRAISVSADGPCVDALTCIDCGACVSVCPTGAIVPVKPTDRVLAERIATEAASVSRVTIACGRVASPDSGIATVRCLARLDPSLLLFAFARGAGTVNLCTGVCDDCSAGEVGPRVASVVAATQRILDSLGLLRHVELHEGLETVEVEEVAQPAQPTGLTRRGLFGLLKRGGTDAAVKTASTYLPGHRPAAAAERPAREGAYVPAKRRRLLAALRGLVPEGPVCRESGVFAGPALDQTRCDRCAVCGLVCPTGALSIETDGEGDVLSVVCRPSVCVECGLCVEICGRQALSLAPVEAALVLAPDAPCQTLVTRTQKDAESLYVSAEDRMKQLLGVAVYRT